MSEDIKYVGDGLYCKDRGYSLEVFSYNGMEVLDKVYFEPDTAVSAVLIINDWLFKQGINLAEIITKRNQK